MVFGKSLAKIVRLRFCARTTKVGFRCLNSICSGSNFCNLHGNNSTLVKQFSGQSGHDLEFALGLKPNNANKSDFPEFELKLYGSKITFGD